LEKLGKKRNEQKGVLSESAGMEDAVGGIVAAGDSEEAKLRKI